MAASKKSEVKRNSESAGKRKKGKEKSSTDEEKARENSKSIVQKANKSIQLHEIRKEVKGVSQRNRSKAKPRKFNARRLFNNEKNTATKFLYGHPILTLVVC